MAPNIEEDYYEILEISETADKGAIKASYRRLARIRHPDKNPYNLNATAEFQLLAAAHDTLSDDAKRREYDRDHYPRIRLRRGPRKTTSHGQSTATSASTQALSTLEAKMRILQGRQDMLKRAAQNARMALNEQRETLRQLRAEELQNKRAAEEERRASAARSSSWVFWLGMAAEDTAPTAQKERYEREAMLLRAQLKMHEAKEESCKRMSEQAETRRLDVDNEMAGIQRSINTLKAQQEADRKRAQEAAARQAKARAEMAERERRQRDLREQLRREREEREREEREREEREQLRQKRERERREAIELAIRKAKIEEARRRGAIHDAIARKREAEAKKEVEAKREAEAKEAATKKAEGVERGNGGKKDTGGGTKGTTTTDEKHPHQQGKKNNKGKSDKANKEQQPYVPPQETRNVNAQGFQGGHRRGGAAAKSGATPKTTKAAASKAKPQPRTASNTAGPSSEPGVATAPRVDCLHSNVWERVEGRHTCERCSREFWVFALRCRSCSMVACYSCHNSLRRQPGKPWTARTSSAQGPRPTATGRPTASGAPASASAPSTPSASTVPGGPTSPTAADATTTASIPKGPKGQKTPQRAASANGPNVQQRPKQKGPHNQPRRSGQARMKASATSEEPV